MPRKAMRIAPNADRRPAARGAMSLGAPRKVRGGASNITELFDLGGRFERNELVKDEIDRLRQMIDSDGLPQTAKLLEVSTQTVLFAAAGFGHRLQRKTAAKVRDFFRS